MKAGGHKKIKVGQRTRRWPCAPFAGNFFCLACEFVPLLKLPPRACPGATGKNVCMIVSFLLSCLDHWASIGAISWWAFLHQDEISKGWDTEGGRCRRGKVPVSWPVSKDFLGAPPLSSKCLKVVSCFFSASMFISPWPSSMDHPQHWSLNRLNLNEFSWV